VDTAHRIGGVVLCGGLSRRMGQPKAWLPFGDEYLLERVVRIVSAVADHVVVAAAGDLDLPPLPDAVGRVDEKGDGPLAAMACGLEALSTECRSALVVACDMPLLRTEFLQAICAALGKHQAAMPLIEGKLHPLAGIYRMDTAEVARRCLAEGHHRLPDLLEQLEVVRLPRSLLCPFDPDLESLTNVNTPEDYRYALTLAASDHTPRQVERIGMGLISTSPLLMMGVTI
jgi:molybdopterin-guanine dinucleotide biosynthesis protein A